MWETIQWGMVIVAFILSIIHSQVLHYLVKRIGYSDAMLDRLWKRQTDESLNDGEKSE